MSQQLEPVLNTIKVGNSGLFLTYRVPLCIGGTRVLLEELRKADLAIEESKEHVMVTVQSGDLRRLARLHYILTHTLTDVYDLSHPCRYNVYNTGCHEVRILD